MAKMTKQPMGVPSKGLGTRQSEQVLAAHGGPKMEGGPKVSAPKMEGKTSRVSPMDPGPSAAHLRDGANYLRQSIVESHGHPDTECKSIHHRMGGKY